MRFVLFLLLNFGALYVGSLFMGGSPAKNTWYQGLNQAPWTPPGWVFGFAWTTIMVLYSVYLARIFKDLPKDKFKLAIGLFLAQWVLNVSWNPLFFVHHALLLGCSCILLLFAVIILFHITLVKKRPYEIVFVLPYLVWLGVAFSLNLYVLLYN